MSISIDSSLRAFQYFQDKFDPTVEEFWALALTSQKRPINCRMLFRGTVDRCMVHPRDVFRFALLANASSLILAHNHPQGQSMPSTEDIVITERLLQISKIMDLPLDDHLILAAGSYFSFADQRQRPQRGR